MRAIGLVLALPLLSVSMVAWAGENLVPNASFELGRWSPSLYGMDDTRHWLDYDDPAMGRCCEVMVCPPVNGATLSGAKVESQPFRIEPNQTYTVSFYAKGEPTPLSMGYQVHSRGGMLEEKFFQITDQWKRYSFPVTLGAISPPYVNLWIGTYVTGGKLWLDGVQVEEGDLTDFKVANQVEIGILTDHPCNVVFSRESCELTLRVQNGKSEPLAGQLHCLIKDYQGNVIRDDRLRLALAPGALWEQRQSLGAPPVGHYACLAKVEVEGEEVAGKYSALAVIRPTELTAPRPDSYFGTQGLGLGEMWRLMIAAGSTSSRSYFYWGRMNPAKGQYQEDPHGYSTTHLERHFQ